MQRAHAVPATATTRSFGSRQPSHIEAPAVLAAVNKLLFERPQRTLQATMVASSTSKWARASKTDDGGFQPGRLNMFSPYAAALSRASKT